MKKGLILALLVVAMVALVLPVSARAPIIKSLPTIIIGDNEGATGTPPKGILRFPAALDLKDMSVVDWNNDESYTSDTFHAYLYPADATPATAIKPYGFGRVIGTLTTPEYTNLVGAGTMPAPDTRITSYTSPSSQNWLVNLYDEGRHVLTDPATADPATQGVDQDTYSKEVAMKLVCGVTSGSTLVASQADLTVKSQSSTSDSVQKTFTELAGYSFTGSNDGWTFSTYAGFDAATPTTSGPGTTGIGFVVSSPIQLTQPCMYSIWMSPAVIPSNMAQNGKVFRATATLESTSTSPSTAVGYRLRYFSTGFAHQGFMIVKSTPSVANDAVSVPYAGNPFTAKVFWAPRPDLGDMGDAEGQALLVGDYRKYKLAWEIIGLTGEQGTLTMESIYIDSFAKPATVAKAVAWGSGSGEIPFNAADAAGGMQTRDDLSAIGFANGSIAATAANAVITLTGAEKTKRYVGIKPSWAAPLLNVKPVSNHLYRFSATLACGSRTAVPTYRICVNAQLVPPPPAPQLGALRDIAWIDWFSFCNAAGAGGKQVGFMLPGQTVAPFAPATGAGSVIDVYVYSHSIAPTTTGTSIFVPILNSVDCGVYGTATVWPDPVTAMTWSAASWEDLGADY